MFKDVPLFALAVTVCLYWATVVALVIHKRFRHGRAAGLVPRNRYERRLWLLIVPVIGAWLVLPFLAGARLAWFDVPTWAHEVHWVYAARCTAATLAVGCYLLSLCCWFSLGRHWSMAIVPGQTTQLVQKGPYRWVRHPIYGLSVTLMLASAMVLPTAPMALVACLHVVAMNLKARHEERYLTESLGPAYLDYSRKVGRFWPRLSALHLGSAN